MSHMELLSEDSKRAGLYLVELMRGALNGEQTKEKPEAVSWENVYKLAKLNHVESVSAYGLAGLENLPEEELLTKWESMKNKTLFKILHFDTEREQIFLKMAEEGLSYLPLKGILLAGYYREPGMRSMADNDILYGFVEQTENGEYRICGKNETEQEKTIQRAQKVMVEIMKERGFSVEHLLGNHDSFVKKPFFNFEMHRELLSSNSTHQEYYKNSWAKAIQAEDSPYGFHMSAEDEYIFILVHMEKHFSLGGCGIRHLNDVYVFWQKKGAMLDRAYLQQEFEKLDMVAFEQKIRSLAFAIYAENRPLCEEEEQLLFFLLGCGMYGRDDVKIENQMKQISEEKETSMFFVRLQYIKNRFCIDPVKVKEYYPFFYKHPYARPFLPVYRVVKGLLIHPKKLLCEWKHIWKKDRK